VQSTLAPVLSVTAGNCASAVESASYTSFGAPVSREASDSRCSPD
jgi:hypothetical protein